MTSPAESASRSAKALRRCGSSLIPALYHGRTLFRFGLCPLAEMGQERALAQANGFRRHLDQLVILDIGDRLLERRRDHRGEPHRFVLRMGDRKSTRLNSSHQIISYAVFCLKKKKKNVLSSIRMALDAHLQYKLGDVCP